MCLFCQRSNTKKGHCYLIEECRKILWNEMTPRKFSFSVSILIVKIFFYMVKELRKVKCAFIYFMKWNDSTKIFFFSVLGHTAGILWSQFASSYSQGFHPTPQTYKILLRKSFHLVDAFFYIWNLKQTFSTTFLVLVHHEVYLKKCISPTGCRSCEK